jgi:hypothetical protein
MVRLIRDRAVEAATLAQDDVRFFLVGFSHFSDVPTWDRESQLSAWKLLSPHIISRWLAALPGSRPAGWWMFDAAELRRQITGPRVESSERYWLGMPNPRPAATDFETEADYLTRLALWRPGEREAFDEIERELRRQSGGGEPDDFFRERHRHAARQSILSLFPMGNEI